MNSSSNLATTITKNSNFQCVGLTPNPLWVSHCYKLPEPGQATDHCSSRPQNYLYFPIVELYKNFNALPPLNCMSSKYLCYCINVFITLINYLLYLEIILHFIDLFMVTVRGTVTVCMCLLCNQHLGNDQLNLKADVVE